jgi:hypothetical protein
MSGKRKAGRPASDPATHRPKRNFTLSPGALELLDALAARLGLSKSAAIELAIRKLSEQENVRT